MPTQIETVPASSRLQVAVCCSVTTGVGSLIREKVAGNPEYPQSSAFTVITWPFFTSISQSMDKSTNLVLCVPAHQHPCMHATTSPPILAPLYSPSIHPSIRRFVHPSIVPSIQPFINSSRHQHLACMLLRNHSLCSQPPPGVDNPVSPVKQVLTDRGH